VQALVEWQVPRYSTSLLERRPGQLSDLGYRLTGSSDLYQFDGRKPYASINFITAHDGFTLSDLVSYDAKHNEANKDDNRNGTDQNDSWNMGAEGSTDDENINRMRERQMRNFLATLMLSQGVSSRKRTRFTETNRRTWFRA
jgi:isoamylase